MRTYSGFQKTDGAKRASILNRAAKFQVASIVMVFAVVLFFGMFRGFGPLGGGGQVMRFFYPQAASADLAYVDIAFPFDIETTADTHRALELGLTQAPAGGSFLPPVAPDVTINMILSLPGATEIRFSSDPFAHITQDEARAAARAIANTLFELYPAQRVYISAAGQVITTIDR